MRSLHRQASRVGIWTVVFLSCVLAGCTRRYEFNTALIGIPEAQKYFPAVPNVNILVVAPDGTVFPKDVLIRSGTYAVVWVAVGKKLELTFENSSIQPLCEAHGSGVICSVGPLSLPLNSYPYKGVLTDSDGREHKIDPKIEIVR